MWGTGAEPGAAALMIDPCGGQARNLALLHHQDFPVLHSFSPLILGKPQDWGRWIHPAGARRGCMPVLSYPYTRRSDTPGCKETRMETRSAAAAGVQQMIQGDPDDTEGGRGRRPG